MIINVYRSTTPDVKPESNIVDREITLGQWFDEQGLDREKILKLPPHITKNGELVKPADWFDTEIKNGDVIDIWMQPGGGLFSSIGSIIGGILGFALGWLMPSQRGHSTGSPEQGRRLESATAKANTAKMGQVVPETFGTFRRYPEYLTAPRRQFVNRREQWLTFLVNIGPGRYSIPANMVKVGDTVFSNLGSDGSYQIFQPNELVSGHAAHENWYSVDEVGGTSSGTAGLELVVDPARSNNTNPASYNFNGLTISRSSGEFPPGWGPGTVLTITYPRPYTVTTEPVSGPFANANVFEGFFGHTVSGFEAFDGWSSAVLTDLGGGFKRVYFYKYDEQFDEYTYYSGEPNGTRTYTFNPGAQWAVQSSDTSTLVLQNTGGRFFESGASVASQITYHSGTLYGEWSSRFIACPVGETTTRFEVDLFFPGGLGFIEDSGNIANRTVQVEVQYRDADAGGAFTSVLKTFTDRTQDQIGFTEVFNVPSMRPEVRLRRVGARAVSTQVLDTVQWYALRSRLPTLTRYPNWTTMAVRIRSGGRMALNSENQINLVVTRMLPQLVNGEWTSPQPTRDIAAAANYVTSTIGYTADDWHMPDLIQLNNIWKTRGETFDYVFDETTVKKALDTIFAAGMSELTVVDGKIKPVRDDVRTTFENEQGYSPANMTRPLVRQFRSRAPDDIDGVEVEFVDADTWEPAVVKCLLPGDAGVKLEKIRIDGVTDRTRAWRIGMRRRSLERYARWDYSFSTELAALNSEYLSYVPLLDDIPGYGKASILLNIENTGNGLALMTVSEPQHWDGSDHVVAYRRQDGTVAGPFPATRGANDFEIISNLPAPWPIITLKHEPPHVYFGKIENWCFPALITSIKPNANSDQVSVKARNYDARVYAYDNEIPDEV